MRLTSVLFAGAMALAAPTSALAITFNGLTGGQIGINDVVFSNFGSAILFGNDIGPINISVDAPNAGDVTIQFDFETPYVLSVPSNEAFEATISFDANVTFGTRNIVGAGLAFELLVNSLEPATFFEIGTNTVPGLLVEVTGSSLISNDFENIAATQSFSPVFDLQGEVLELSDTITVNSFEVTLGLDSEFTPPAVIPLPASVALLGLGLGVMGAARLRKRRN